MMTFPLTGDGAAEPLPLTPLLPRIAQSLRGHNTLVLAAPPGAGKTTLVPLALMDEPWLGKRRILMLEPRRMAARAAAHRMATLLDEPVGERVGYRVRFETRSGPATVIEVVTGGILTRMLANDPELMDIGCILFDEFHERSLDGDMALALCRDLQAGLREDLRLVPMSATLDVEGIAKLLDAPVLESEARAHPVDMVHEPRSPGTAIETAMTAAVRRILAERPSGRCGILAFLPGQRDILRTRDLLQQKIPAGIGLHCLYGAMAHHEQQASVAPLGADERRVVLASAIAETSLTIDGIDVVIDSGLAREPVFEPATGLTRLTTVRVSQAAATQRAGRAGRTGPGLAVRLWHEKQTASLPKHRPPEILHADLAQLVLDLANWGVSDPLQLVWLDPPPTPAILEARTLLKRLGALGGDGMITAHGRLMLTTGLPPRLAHMVVRAADMDERSLHDAALLALLVQERGPGGSSTDLAERLERCRTAKDKASINLTRHAKRLADRIPCKATGKQPGTSAGAGVLLAPAFFDRIARRGTSHEDGTTHYRMASGRGARLDNTSPLAREKFLVIIDVAGRAGAAHILAAASLGKEDIENYLDEHIQSSSVIRFNVQGGALEASHTRRLGAIDIEKPKSVAVDEQEAMPVLLEAISTHGLDLLPWRDADRNLQQRLALLHEFDPSTWPDVAETALLARLDEWLAPFLQGASDLSALATGALSDGLMFLAGHPSKNDLDRLAPLHFTVPSGSTLAIDYGRDVPTVSVRPQELFGLSSHPHILDGTKPLALELVSPAGRPVQITTDLPGFWQGSWRDVRADLRGRYPKHPWPEDPLAAAPTNRAKRRG